MIANLYYGALHAARVTTFVRWARGGGVILCYHNVIPQRASLGDPALHIPLVDFTDQVDWLAAHYDIIPVADFANRIAAGRSLRGTAAITFDDEVYRGVRRRLALC